MFIRPLLSGYIGTNPYVLKWLGNFGLPQAVYPDYNLTYLSQKSYYLGEKFPLKWIFSGMENNGAPYARTGYLAYLQKQSNWVPIPLPTSAFIYIFDSNGTLVSSLIPDTDTAGGNQTLTMMQLWQPSSVGDFVAYLFAYINGQVRAAKQRITVLPAAVGGLSSMAVAYYPDYTVQYQEVGSYILGEEFPVKWAITRADGNNVSLPTSGSITITDSNGNITTLTPSTESSGAASTQILAALWTPAAAGQYTVQLTVSIPADGQIRSGRAFVNVIA